MEAFRKAGIEFILTANEASAGIMADVTGRLTSIPGICHSTFGPGATNISTGIGGAYLDRSPVIVFTSEMSDEMTGRTTQMNINHQELFRPITKATFRLNRKNVKEVIANAVMLCKESYPGPVHIGLPYDLADVDIDDIPESLLSPHKEHYNNDIEAVTTLLNVSRSPLIALGLTAQRHGLKRACPDIFQQG